MPIYEYKCSNCGKHFDVLQKFSDATLAVHEECGGAVERLVSPPAFHFKGTGWYVTDYAKTNGNSSPSGKSEGGSEESKSESKSDSKSDSKATESNSDSKTESKPESKSKSESTPKPASTSSDSK